MAHPLTLVPDFNYAVLNKELELNGDEKDKLETLLKAYLEDDHWQGGNAALLPMAEGGHSGSIVTAFERRFVFRNIIKEMVARVSGAFYGKTPNWRLTTDSGEDVSGDGSTEIAKALNNFWTRQKAAQACSEAFETRLVFGRGGLRIFVPAKYREIVQIEGAEEDTVQEAGFVAFKSIPEAIEAMRIEYIPPAQGRLLEDGGELISLVKYAVRKDWTTTEMVNVIETSFIDDKGDTYIDVVVENETSGSLEDHKLSSPLPLGENTTFSEFQGKPYVTKSMWRCNQLVNLALTCAGFNLVDNGFGEMVLTNVDLETETIPNPDGSGTIEVPKRIRRGGGVSQNFLGLEEHDEQTGTSRRGTPGVTFKEPSAITPFNDGYDLGYTATLAEGNQLHAKISGDATASGESRVQAVADFIRRISPYKPEVDEMGSWVMTTVLKFAATLAGQTSDVSVVYDSRIHVAELTAEERRIVSEMREKGIISRETERVLLGVDDPELEGEMILDEQKVPPTEIPAAEFNERLSTAQQMQSVGIDPVSVLQYLGYKEEQIAAMRQTAIEEDAALQAEINAAEGGPDDGETQTGDGQQQPPTPEPTPNN